MAKASIDTGATAQPVHTRTTGDSTESQAVVIAIDGSDNVVAADTANGLDVDVTRVGGTVTTKHAGSTGAQTIVTSTVTTNTTLLAADSTRVGALLYNDSTSALFVLLGAGTESATVYTLQIGPGGYYEVPEAFVTMRVSGHWATANGAARITVAT